jgi:hypothetical protein
MNATLLLCDFAQPSPDGKITMVGAGWTFIGPDPTPMSVAAIVEVPLDETNYPHTFRLHLRDTDGTTVLDPEGNEVGTNGQFDTGRPPGVPAGVPMTMPIAVNVGPLPLAPATRYVWELTLDDNEDEKWQVAFNTRPSQMRAAS